MKKISAILVVAFLSSSLYAQNRVVENDFTLLELQISERAILADTVNNDDEQEEFPSPRSVMFKSMMVPGWGQIENKQTWKVPIIYAMFAGIGYYTYIVHDQYADYRAAYYNQQRGDETDFKFGPTPEYLIGIDGNQLRTNRNTLRNRRDMMFVVMALAYGLNALDAYVFAHMRSFDVSDDLSAVTTIGPALLADSAPGISFSISLKSK